MCLFSLHQANAIADITNNCEGQITIISPQKPSKNADDAAHFRLLGSKGFEGIYDLSWNRTMTIQNLCPDKYFVIAKQSNEHPAESPTEIVLSIGKPNQSVNLKYLPAQEKISFTIQIEGINKLPPASELIYKSKSQYAKITLAENQKTMIDLIAGEQYQLWIPTTIINNIEYLANYSEKNPLEFTASKTISPTIALSIKKNILTALNINLNIDSTDNHSNRFNISAIGNHGQIYSFENLSQGNHIIQMVADSYQIKIKKQGDSITQSQNIIVAKDNDAIRLEYQPAETSKNIVGYLTNAWGSVVKISDAAKAGYNIIVIAFTKLDSDLSVKFSHRQFQAYTLWGHRIGIQDIENIKADIMLAKKFGLKQILISFDGRNGSFTPKTMNIKTIARNMVKFVNEHHFDGIDFDLESITANVSQQEFLTLLQEIRKIDSTIILSCAPELSILDNQLTYVNQGQDQLYKLSIKQGLFDYIFVQEYNSAGYFVNSDGKTCADNKPGCVDETNPDFILASFPALKRMTPPQTLIFPGQPATKESAGPGSVYHGPDQANIYSNILKSYQGLNEDLQFGGVMVWNINDDFNNDFEFVKTIKNGLKN